MTRNEFRQQLDQLQDVILRGLAYYEIWSKLRLHDEAGVSWSREQQNRVLGRFRGFFAPIALALVDMVLMQFAKAFDSRRGTASLPNLLRAARQDASLVSGRQSKEVDEVSRQLRKQKNIRKRLKRRRNKWIAHVDANPGAADAIMSQEIESLAEGVKSAFSWLSTAHDGRGIAWDFLPPKPGQHTADVLGRLLEGNQAQAG